MTLSDVYWAAHVAGKAGAELGGKVRKIVGLDPAGPLFDINDPNNRLNVASAKYTECIHTGFYLGIGQPICKVDFFLNKGSHQPGCVSKSGNDNIVCSHVRAVQIYTEALLNPVAFYGFLCNPDHSQHIPGQLLAIGECNDAEKGLFINDENNLELAEETSNKVYNVVTNGKAPFGREYHPKKL